MAARDTMPQFMWRGEKYSAANTEPDALLGDVGDNDQSFFTGLGLDFSSAPFLRSLSPKSPRGRSRCCSFAGFLVVSCAIALSVLCFRHLLHFWLDDGQASYEHYEESFVDGVSKEHLRNYLKEITKEPHIAGSSENFVTADYVYGNFIQSGISTHFTDYDVLLSYPTYRSLQLSGAGTYDGGFELKEDVIEEDSYTKNPKIVSTFHGYAPSGNASGEVVYANYGREEDYEKLEECHVDVKGAIVIARYGQIYRGDIVANAAKRGAAAVVTFSDPANYGDSNNTSNYYPNAPWLPPSGVQRGSVFQGIGDPLTPGWASTPGAERVSLGEADLPPIPSLPISGRDAARILKGIEGELAPKGWRGALHNVNYTIGRGPARLNLTYEARQDVYPIRNVIGIIQGSEEPDRYLVLGNHRDAWVFGAVDPNSGTAALLELARGFGELSKLGWKPRRSIVLASWDAEEYGMIGSTEWVEANLGMLGSRAVAYINVDCAVAGPGFVAAGSPQLDALIQEVTKEVADPEGHFATVYDAWAAANPTQIPKIGRLGGGGSDFVAFLQHAGVPSIDLAFGADYPVYHSAYDNYHWMEKFGDPKFERHVAVTKIFGIIALRLADSAILSFDYLAYAKELQDYAHEVQETLDKVEAPVDVTVTPMHSAIVDFLKSAAYMRQETDSFQAQQLTELRPGARDIFYHLLRRRAVNDRLMLAERAFLDPGGLPGRTWYKHLVYGPATHNNYGSINFPGIMDKLRTATRSPDKANWRAVQHEIWRVARVITKVSSILRANLS